MLEYAERSRNRVLHEMAKELRELLHPEAETPATVDVCYRGATPPASGQVIGAANGEGKVRVYRGCVIQG